MTDEKLLEILQEKYSPFGYPLCSICGDIMTLQENGRRITWGCTTFTTDKEGNRIFKDGRNGMKDDHFVNSLTEDPQTSDPLVIELIKRFKESKKWST